MLKKISSLFILKKIFTIINNKVKFNSIIHNKKLQKKLGLSLIDFKRFSGRYRKKEYGKVIEYNKYNNRIIFEGYYSNGKKNGRGKEYNEEGDLIFEGEYLNGKRRTGNAKEYAEDTGNLTFEIEYLNGKQEGNVNEYDKYNGKLLFSGNFKTGKKNRFGLEYKYIPNYSFLIEIYQIYQAIILKT